CQPQSTYGWAALGRKSGFVKNGISQKRQLSLSQKNHSRIKSNMGGPAEPAPPSEVHKAEFHHLSLEHIVPRHTGMWNRKNAINGRNGPRPSRWGTEPTAFNGHGSRRESQTATTRASPLR